MGGSSFAAIRRRQFLTALAVIALAIPLPFLVRDVYLQNMLVLTLLYCGLSQAWNLLGGYCGQISLGHAIYFGFGAYISTILYVRFGVTPWAGMVVGGAISSGLALLLGYQFFRLKGHYFTIATIVVAEMAYLLILNWEWAGGAQGIQVPFRPDSWLNLQFARNKIPYYFFALGLAAVVWFVTYAIEDSRWGYLWRAVKDNPDAAQSLGVEVFSSKMAAAAVSAFFTSVGGSFYAQFVGYIDPNSVLNFHFSLLMALPAVLGGIGTLWGPALGAAILIPMTELTRSYAGGTGSGLDLIIYGILIMVIALLRPQGLVSLKLGKARMAAGKAQPQ